MMPVSPERTLRKTFIFLPSCIKKEARQRADTAVLITMLSIQAISAFFGLGIVGLIAALVVAIVGEIVQPAPNHGKAVNAIILLLFQNLIIGVCCHYGPGEADSLSFLTQIGTVYIFSAGIFGLWRMRDKKMAVFAIFGIVLLGVLFLLSSAEFAARMSYFRNFSLIFFAYGLFGWNLNSYAKQQSFLKAFIILAGVALVFGILTYPLGYEFWKGIGINEVYIAKGDPGTSDSMNGRFYTTLISSVVMRMGGLYYEPVNMGYFFIAAAFACLLYSWEDKRRKVLFFLAVNLGILLTFAKGSWLLYFLILGLWAAGTAVRYLWNLRDDPSLTKKAFFVLLVVGIVAVGAFASWYAANVGGAASPHFWAIRDSIPTIAANPLGIGMGIGGNLGVASYAAGAESGLMSLFVQIGIPAAFVVLLFFILLTPNIKGMKKNIFRFFIPISLIAISIFQENTFSPQCLMPVISLCFIGELSANKIYQYLVAAGITND